MATRSLLPVHPTAIIGRESETKDLCSLLLSDGVRLITLTGPGGIGKTRLAIHIASLLADNFEDGVQFVPLAHITDPALVVVAIAQTLDIQNQGTMPVRDSLISFLRGRHMLLVLDNFEQIIDAAVDIAELLATCHNLTILVTSRIILHVRGEHELAVPPLALPDNDASAESLSQYAAVLLFIQRASAVRPDFKLTNANAPAVAEICARLDGLPLAIELAAARVKILTPQAMLPRLNNRLQLLKGGAVDLPQRQQTLRNTIAWSYELLEPHEQMLFRRLSVFQGYWNLEAAEAVCGMEDILEGVQSLADKSMVQQREMQNGEQYFILLETLREFALEHLQEQETAHELFAQHAEYYLALAESYAEDHPDDVFEQWFRAIDISFNNVRAAFHWFRQTEQWENAGRLFSALQEYWLARNITGETTSWLEYLHPHMQEISVPVRCGIYNLEGYLLRDTGDSSKAISNYREIERLLNGTEHTRLRDTALNCMGVCLVLTGDFNAAEEIYNELLPRLRKSGDIIGASKAMLHYAYLCERSDRGSKAVELLEESTELLRRGGFRRRTAINLANLSNIYAYTNSARAQKLAEEALDICCQFNNRPSEIRSLLVLAGIAMREERYADSGKYLLRGFKSAYEVASARSLIPIMLHFTDLFKEQAAYEVMVPCLACANTLMQDFLIEYHTAFGTAHEEEIAELRRLVGEEEFDRMWREGKQLSLVQIESRIQQALARGNSAEPEPVETATPISAPAQQQTTIPDTLTTRETEILRLLALGLSNKEIGEQLFISERTVHAHVRSIYSKLDISSRSAATRFALENGVV